MNYYKRFEDGFAEYLMRPNGQIDNALCSLSSSLNKKFTDFFYIVEYKDLVNDGGYIIFDDYNDFGWNPVVKHGVDMIVNEYLFDEYEVLGFVYNKLKAAPDNMIYNNEFVLRKIIK